LLPAAASVSIVHGLRHTERILDELFAGPTAGRRSLQAKGGENDKSAWLNTIVYKRAFIIIYRFLVFHASTTTTAALFFLFAFLCFAKQSFVIAVNKAMKKYLFS